MVFLVVSQMTDLNTMTIVNVRFIPHRLNSLLTNWRLNAASGPPRNVATSTAVARCLCAAIRTLVDSSGLTASALCIARRSHRHCRAPARCRRVCRLSLALWRHSAAPSRSAGHVDLVRIALAAWRQRCGARSARSRRAAGGAGIAASSMLSNCCNTDCQESDSGSTCNNKVSTPTRQKQQQ
jgi:hypothetical protein